MLLTLYKDKRSGRAEIEAKDYSKISEKKKASDILQMDGGRKEVKYTLEFHKEGIPKQQGLKGFTGRLDGDGNPIFSSDDESKRGPINHGEKSSNDYIPKTTQVTKSGFSYYKEPSFNVVLKPSFNNKLVLVTDIDLFIHKISKKVAKGICMLCNAGIFPSNVFTKLRLCHMGNGLIYKIGITKNGFSYNIDRKTRSFGAMPDTQFAQTSFLIDASVAIRKSIQTKNQFDLLKQKAPNLLTNFNPSSAEKLVNAGLINDCQFVIPDLLIQNLKSYNSLICYARRHIIKAVTDKILAKYIERVPNVRLIKEWKTKGSNSLSDWTLFNKPYGDGEYEVVFSEPKGYTYNEYVTKNYKTCQDVNKAVSVYSHYSAYQIPTIHYTNRGDSSKLKEEDILTKVKYLDHDCFIFPVDNMDGQTFFDQLENADIRKSHYANLINYLTGKLENMTITLDAGHLTEQFVKYLHPVVIDRIKNIGNLRRTYMTKYHSKDRYDIVSERENLINSVLQYLYYNDTRAIDKIKDYLQEPTIQKKFNNVQGITTDPLNNGVAYLILLYKMVKNFF